MRPDEHDSVLYAQSQVRPSDIVDGLSTTIAVGERPAPAGYRYGWWYGGAGVYGTGALDSHLGVRESPADIGPTLCPFAPGQFGPGRTENPCDALHFWSFHTGGGNFTFADGSVRFVRFDANSILPAWATRAGGEVAPLN